MDTNDISFINVSLKSWFSSDSKVFDESISCTNVIWNKILGFWRAGVQFYTEQIGSYLHTKTHKDSYFRDALDLASSVKSCDGFRDITDTGDHSDEVLKLINRCYDFRHDKRRSERPDFSELPNYLIHILCYLEMLGMPRSMYESF